MKIRYFWLAPIGLLLTACTQPAATDPGPATVTVTTQPVHLGQLPQRLDVYGSAMAPADASLTLNSPADAVVMQVNVVEGQPVRRGQIVASLKLSPAAQATEQQARTALEQARLQHTYVTQLLSHQLATRDQLAQADRTLADARIALTSLQQQQGQAPTAVLTAPADGVISSVLGNVGARLAQGAPLLTLLRSSGVVMVAGLEPALAGLVHPGDPAMLWPASASSAPALNAATTRVAAMVNPRSRLLDLELSPQQALLPGMAYRAQLTVGQWHGWVVPRQALVGDAAPWSLFQIKAGKAIRVQVKLLGEADADCVVAGALDPALPLVVGGVTQLDDGSAVRIGRASP